jgi:hypothetical protein
VSFPEDALRAFDGLGFSTIIETPVCITLLPHWGTYGEAPMAIEFLSILIFSFALALFCLGAITWFMDRGKRRSLAILMVVSALVIAGGYAFLGSRFSIAVFGRLIITIDLPRLMTTASVYTIGVLLGLGLAGGVFLWISGRLVRPTGLERKLALFIVITLVIALGISLIAVQISH